MGLQANLKAIRKSRGITGKSFALMLGIKYTTYHGYETRGTWPSEKNLTKIADALQVSIDELIGHGSGGTYMEKYFNLKERIMKQLLEEEKDNGKH